MLLVLAALAAPTPDFKPRASEWNPAWDYGCAASGLAFYALSSPSSHVATVVTVVDVGAADDPPGREGMAHLLEHLSYRAQVAGDRTLRDELSPLADFNGFTSLDTTTYVETGLASDLPRALALAGQRLADPLRGVTEAELATELAVVRHEARQFTVERVGELYTRLYGALFPPTHRYARGIHSSAASGREPSLAELRTFAATHYRPENASFFVVSPLDASAARAATWRALPDVVVGVPEGQARRTCGDFRPPQVAAPLAAPTGDERIRVEAPVQHGELTLAWSIPGGDGPERMMQEQAVRVLGDRLYWPCDLVPAREASVVTCDRPLLPGEKVDAVEREALSALRAFSTSAARALELQRGRRDMPRQELLHSTESLLAPLAHGNLAAFRWAHTWGRPSYHADLAEADARLPVAESVAYASEWFTAERAVRAEIVPAAAAPMEFGTAHAQARRAASSSTGNPAELARAGTPTGLVHRRLDNGLDIYAVRRGDVPLMAAQVAFDGGDYPAIEPGTATALAASVVWRPRNIGFDPSDYAVTAAVQTWLAGNTALSGYEYMGPDGNLDEVLWLVRNRLEGESIDDDSGMDVAEWVARRQRWRFIDPVRGLWWVAERQLFAASPWVAANNRADWHRAELSALSARKRLLQSTRQPELSNLLVAGPLDPSVVVDEAARALAKWPVPQQPPAPLPDAAVGATGAGSPAVTIIPDTRSRGATLFLVCPVGGGEADPRVSSLGALASGRLFAALRSQSGLAYTPELNLHFLPFAGNYVEAIVNTTPRSMGEAAQKARAVLAGLSSLEDDDAARRASIAAARGWALGRATLRGLLDQMAIMAREGGAADWFDLKAEAYGRVDAASIREVAAPCISRLQVVMLGPEADAVAASAALGVEATVRAWPGVLEAALGTIDGPRSDLLRKLSGI